jgi:hypothetical protein
MLARDTPSAAAHTWGYTISLDFRDAANSAVACSGSWSVTSRVIVQEFKV